MPKPLNQGTRDLKTLAQNLDSLGQPRIKKFLDFYQENIRLKSTKK